jgi:hypothetical protein
MVHAVNRQLPNSEACVHIPVSPRWICGVHSGTETGISPRSSDFPCQYHSTVTPYYIYIYIYIYISHKLCTIGPFVFAVQIHNLTAWTETGSCLL